MPTEAAPLGNDTNPPGPITGHVNGKCYANRDSNCSENLSKEHFISEALLKQIQLNKTVKIAGLKWQEAETFKIIPLPALASSILCERHNNAMSPLDSNMGAFSQAISEYDAAMRPGAATALSERRTFSGDDIERWMLKCLLGLRISKNFSGELKDACLDLLFTRMVWPKGWGLYLALTVGKPIYHSSSFLIETFIDPAQGLILVANFGIKGLPFVLCMGRPDSPERIGVFRPAGIVLQSDKCNKELLLNWQAGPSTGNVALDRRGSYDGPPPDWKGWEQSG